jgi:uncharacterized membrane protein
MQTIRFIWRTIVAGTLFLAPLFILFFVLREGFHLLARALKPIASLLPIQAWFGMDQPEIAAALILLIAAFLAGLVMRPRIAARLNRTIENWVLRKMPGYTIFKSIAQGTAGMRGEIKVALANIDDAWLMAFIIERLDDGLLTVFIPSAPTPTAGNVYFLREDQVKRLDITVSAAVQCIMQLGVGSRELLATKSPSSGL